MPAAAAARALVGSEHRCEHDLHARFPVGWSGIGEGKAASMADENEAPEEDVEDSEETEDEGEAEDGESSGKKKKKSGGGKKKSRAKMFILIGALGFLGIATIAGVVAYNEWHKRQLAKNWGMEQMSPEERAAYEAEQKAKAEEEKLQAFVEKKHINRTFFDECKLMSDQYTTPKGWNYAKLPLSMLLGLPKYSPDGAIDERCAEFATIVERMESLSHHDRHVFMCKASVFKLPGGYFFEVDPKGRGIYHGHDAIPNDKKFIPIKPGKSKIYAQWQFYNVGDGCNVVGFSKMRGQIFTMGGEMSEK